MVSNPTPSHHYHICVSSQVADQCKENIFAIETLKDFQYFEENKDQGMNVREKAKALVTLLKVSVWQEGPGQIEAPRESCGVARHLKIECITSES